VRVDLNEGAARRPEALDVQREPEPGEALLRPEAELVLAERRVEVARPREPEQLGRDDGAAARRLLPVRRRMGDLAGAGNAVDEHRLHPFHVPDDRASHSVAGSHV
jgi:hypothetical protein